jgi:hypothetical protein
MYSKKQEFVDCVGGKRRKEVHEAFDMFTNYRNSMRGRMFTVMEAIVTNEQQLKANKDLIDTIIWDDYFSGEIYEMMDKIK